MKLNEITLNEQSINMHGYSLLQWFAIYQWGQLLYLSYQYLPHGAGNKTEVIKHAKEFLTAIKNGDDEFIEEFVDWVDEGMSFSGEKLLTRELYDKIMTSAATKSTSDMTLYRSGDISPNYTGWTSATINQGRYDNQGDESSFMIPKGTPMIDADGIADNGEIIIQNKYLK